MKTRFYTVDIRALVKNLQSSILGMRVTNVYDINPRTYLLKLAKPDHKAWLLIESGIRVHTTEFTRDKSELPSVFSIKLRKYLRTKRLENVQQLGIDRIVVLTFGSGPVAQHLIVELYAQGNIILTDGDYQIQALLRPYKYSDDLQVAVNHPYPTSIAKTLVPLTLERFNEVLTQATKTDSLKQAFLKALDLGPELVEHCIVSAGLKPDMKLSAFDATHTQELFEALKAGEQLFDQLGQVNAKGYILVRADSGGDVYEEYAPYLFQQHVQRGTRYLEFSTFDHAVDEFYSKIETQKATLAAKAQEQAVQKKIDKFREEHNRRIASLQQGITANERKARLIEANLQEVEQCLLVIRSALAQGMDWNELVALIKEERKRNAGSVANIIHRLHLERNQMTLMLSDPLEDEEDEEEEEEEDSEDEDSIRDRAAPRVTRAPELVDVDIALSAYANARRYFELKKQSTQKAQKTIDKTEQALKAAERKSRRALAETKSKQSIQIARKPFWFEKFFWFISSDNYIVVCGRDMQQNELLYKRYLEKDDIYVHADLHGASTCIIKNPTGGPIPPQTLAEAGTMCVCLSAAWQAKIVTSAWWVYSHQVSKTAPSGEYLTTGSFMIRGKKNFLPPSQLVLGFGFLFRMDESSIPRHLGERSRPSLSQSSDGSPSAQDGQSTSIEQTPSSDSPVAVPSSEGDGSSDIESEGESDSDEQEQPDVDVTKVKIQLITNLEEEDNGEDVDEGQEQEEEPNKQVDNRKRLTAHERRKLKKGKSQFDTQTQQTQQQQQKQPKGKADKADTTKSTPQTKKEAKGKGKGKKGKSKYQDLDEEEQQARKILLGITAPGKPEKDSSNKQKDTKTNKQATTKPDNKVKTNTSKRQGQQQKTEKGEDRATDEKLCFKCGQPGHIGAACPKAQATAPPHAEPEGGEDEGELDEENVEGKGKLATTGIDTLTARPYPDDVLLHAIPVLAPYSVMTGYKFRLKVTPGHTKRGKAARAAIEALFRHPGATPREKELIRAVPLEEAVREMVGNAKLHVPHGRLPKGKAQAKKDKDIDIDLLPGE